MLPDAEVDADVYEVFEEDVFGREFAVLLPVLVRGRFKLRLRSMSALLRRDCISMRASSASHSRSFQSIEFSLSPSAMTTLVSECAWRPRSCGSLRVGAGDWNCDCDWGWEGGERSLDGEDREGSAVPGRRGVRSSEESASRACAEAGRSAARSRWLGRSLRSRSRSEGRSCWWRVCGRLAALSRSPVDVCGRRSVSLDIEGAEADEEMAARSAEVSDVLLELSSGKADCGTRGTEGMLSSGFVSDDGEADARPWLLLGLLRRGDLDSGRVQRSMYLVAASFRCDSLVEISSSSRSSSSIDSAPLVGEDTMTFNNRQDELLTAEKN